MLISPIIVVLNKYKSECSEIHSKHCSHHPRYFIPWGVHIRCLLICSKQYLWRLFHLLCSGNKKYLSFLLISVFILTTLGLFLKQSRPIILYTIWQTVIKWNFLKILQTSQSGIFLQQSVWEGGTWLVSYPLLRESILLAEKLVTQYCLLSCCFFLFNIVTHSLFSPKLHLSKVLSLFGFLLEEF